VLKQAFRVYNTNLSGAPEWGGFDWQTTTNTLRIGTDKSGTGASQPIDFVVGGTARFSITTDSFLKSQSGPNGGIALCGQSSTTHFLEVLGASAFLIANNSQVVAAINRSSVLGFSTTWTGLFAFGTSATNANGFGTDTALGRNAAGTVEVNTGTAGAYGFLKAKLQTSTAYTATVVVPTGFLTLYDSTGTAYRVPCVV
jgi:hypothetical protein